MRPAGSPEPPPLLLLSPAGNGAGEDAEMSASPDREREAGAGATAFSAKISLPLGSIASPRAIWVVKGERLPAASALMWWGGQFP